MYNGTDSKFHRVFECEKLTDLRKRFRKTINWVKRQPEAVFAFGVFPSNCQMLLLKDGARHFTCERVIPCDGSLSHVFTDGSGGAAIEVNWGSSKWQLIGRSIVPGMDHSSFRGESFAVLIALQSKKAIHLYVDCAAVVNLLQQIIECHSSGGQLPAFASPDIWNDIVWHIFNRRPGEVMVTKIEAHQNWKALSDGQKRLEGFF